MALADNVDLTLLSRQLLGLQQEVASMRADYRSVAMTLPRPNDLLHRLDQRMSQIDSDIVTNVKIEIGGAFALLETRIEQRVDAYHEESLGANAAHRAAIDQRLDEILAAVRALKGK